MFQLNTFWKLSKMTITKPYEQMWCQTFYFGPPIFVLALNVKWNPHEFLQNFRKGFRASIKFNKVLLDLKAEKNKWDRGVFAKCSPPLSPQCLPLARHAAVELPPAAPCQAPPSLSGG